MTTSLLAPPRPREAERRPLERADAARSENPSRRSLDGWACGVAASGDRHPDDRCRDVVPELIIELL